MTYRAKPAVRTRRAAWDSPERRNLLLNLGFGLVVVLALLLLVVAAAVTWYNDHLSPVASVNGQAINRDDFNRRFDVENLRLDLAEGRILDEFNAGRITAEQRDTQAGFIEQQRQQIASIALERLIDARVQAQLAQQEGIAVTDADVDARIADEATRPEQRHVWMIAVEPDPSDEETEPTEADISAAQRKAEDALADLESGTAWEDVVVEVSTDPSASAGGDLGYITAEDDYDQAFLDAVFALQPDEYTDVIRGEDDVFRIGRITEIVPEQVEPQFRELVADRGVPTEVYVAAVREDVVGEKLREKIEEQALAPGPQREVLEIYLENRSLPAELPEGSVKTRHILYAPNDAPDGASELPEDDPAWAEAEAEAREAHETLTDDLDRFDELAREESDEQAAAETGGKLPWFDPSQQQSQGGGLDDAFGAAIFAEGLEPGQLLEPVRSGFGWHVIQVMYFPTDVDQANRLKAELEDGADFATLARDYSYAPSSAEGGELGWVAKFQLDQQSEAAIFATPVGEITDPVSVDGDGVHLYKVLAEENREPEGEQRDSIEASAFSNWYAAKKEGFEITRDVDFSAAG